MTRMKKMKKLKRMKRIKALSSEAHASSVIEHITFLPSLSLFSLHSSQYQLPVRAQRDTANDGPPLSLSLQCFDRADSMSILG